MSNQIHYTSNFGSNGRQPGDMQPASKLNAEDLWYPAVPQVSNGPGQNGGDAYDKMISWALVLMCVAAGHEYNRNVACSSTVTHHSLPTSSGRMSAGIGRVINAPDNNGGIAHYNPSTSDPMLSQPTGDSQYSQFAVPISATTNASAFIPHHDDQTTSDQTENRLPAGDCGDCCAIIIGFAVAYSQQANPCRDTVASFRCSKCRSECTVMANRQNMEGEMSMGE